MPVVFHVRRLATVSRFFSTPRVGAILLKGVPHYAGFAHGAERVSGAEIV